MIPSDQPNWLVYTRNEPVGVVAAIAPWNSLLLLLLSGKVAPALAAGCTLVCKPSDYTPASTLALAALVEEAGFPPGVVTVLTGWAPEVGQALSAHSGVDKIAFVGSTQVAKLIARAAAENRIGNPLDAQTEMGPLATGKQYAAVLSHVESAREEGATFAHGGGKPEGPGGYVVEPRDVQRAHGVAAGLRAGTVWVNAYRVVGPHVPFGGFGQSGIRRENGVETIAAHTETKAVWVELTGATRDPSTLG